IHIQRVIRIENVIVGVVVLEQTRWACSCVCGITEGTGKYGLCHEWNAYDPLHGLSLILVVVLSAVIVPTPSCQIVFYIPMDLVCGSQRSTRNGGLAIRCPDDSITACFLL